jgi:hypothetical protein
MIKTYHGACHCGAVRFDCDIDLAAGTSRCNCSICLKSRFWKALIKAEALRLHAGAEALSDYQFGSNAIHHLFCRTCGVKPFGRAHFDTEFNGEPLRGEYYAVNLGCLEDATGEELAAAPVRYEDGRHDAWGRAPAVTGHL